METFAFRSGDFVTAFVKDIEKGVGLRELCGVDCSPFQMVDGLINFYAVAYYQDQPVRFTNADFSLVRSEFRDDTAVLVWQHEGFGVVVESCWSFCRDTGIWSRKDVVRNSGQYRVFLSRCLSRFAFSPGRYRVFSQQSGWCDENQGVWRDLENGTFVLSSEGGRTTQDASPFLCLQNNDNGGGVVFHILPCGNWILKVHNHLAEGIIVEAGLSDEHLSLELACGEAFELPEILIQPIPNGLVEAAAPELHRYVLGHFFETAKCSAPVVYNTWFDAFDNLDTNRLRKQLEAAKDVGCEIFVVDAGWYGIGEGSWFQKTGDWRENPDGGFKGRMADFADEVRQAGLGFGLWMEPERNFSTVPAVKEHPEWFLPGTVECFYPDLSRKEVYDYILSEMSRLVEAYTLAWMKVDFNFKFGVDPSGGEFSTYYRRWYELMDELRERFPDVFFEGCASGGMRLDLSTLQHFDGHFLSDNINPHDVLRIYQQALLRLPPGRILKWVALRYVGRTIPQYGLPIDEAPMSFVTPAGNGATWEQSETVSIGFAARVAMPGMFGCTGDLASLSGEAKGRLKYHIDFYKRWREFIVGSVGHLLTPVQRKDDRSGWAAIQLTNPKQSDSLLFVYRLDDECNERRFKLHGISPEVRYAVSVNDSVIDNVKGNNLISDGLTVKLECKNSAEVFILQGE